MYTFWNNILKFPRFFISVLLGFLLTIFNFTIKLFNGPKQSLLITITLCFVSVFLVQILKLMLAIN